MNIKYLFSHKSYPQLIPMKTTFPINIYFFCIFEINKLLSSATTLHHLLCVAKFNTHQTGRFDSFDLMTGYSATSIGQVIRPAMAMFNHSCQPNMVRIDNGKFVLAAATTDIKEGEEVTDLAVSSDLLFLLLL